MTKYLSMHGILGVTATCLLAGAASAAAVPQTCDFDLPQQALSLSLRQVAELSERGLIAPAALLEGRMALPLKGRFTPLEAVERLLRGTGLRVSETEGALVVSEAAGTDEPSPVPADGQSIIVTGTHLRGAQPTSPVIVLSREDIEASGMSSVEEFMRKVPQNQQSGVNQENFGAPGAGADITEHGAGLNLRGLGQRATLVLVNGRRLAPSGAGSFVDVSLIPLSAVERVEIVADGASAIYGSDAVGGVVNFILREDHEGLETLLQAGSATKGDGDQLLLSQTAGTNWGSGRAMLTYEYRLQDEIRAGDRDFTVNMRPDSFLVPRERRHSLFGAFGQGLAPGLDLDLTGFHSRRDTERTYFFASSPLEVDAAAEARGSGLAGTLGYETGAWRFGLDGAWSLSSTEQTQSQPGGQGLVNLRDTRHALAEIELKADGALFDLPGGPVRLAVGAQGRHENYRETFATGIIVPDLKEKSRDVRALFAEVAIPLVSEDNRAPGLERLLVTLAGRYEHYSDFGSTFDPRLGLLWSPVPGLRLRTSWSTSFRAPLLSESVGSYSAIYVPATLVHVDPAGVTGVALALGGSDPDLEPERSRSWSVGADLEPAFLPGLTAGLNYYSVRFSDRIALPSQLITVVGNPAFDAIVTRNPALGDVTAIIGGADLVLDISGPGFSNGGAVPGDVTVIVDGRVSNTAETRTTGLDLSLGYAFSLGGHDFSLDANVTRIFSFEDRLTDSSPVIETLGAPYHPIDWRGRLGLGWKRGGWSGNLFLNHAGDYRDNRTADIRPVDSHLTVDAGLAYAFGDGSGWLSGTRLGLTAENLFDEDPPRLAPDPGAPTGLGYDPVNASGRGRQVSFHLRRAW